jgi:protein tyrosine/serine phosphatase
MPTSVTSRQNPTLAWLASLTSLCLLTTYAVAQKDASATDPKHSHPSPDTSIHRFAEIDADIYKGSKPRTDADYRFLQSKNVKTIINIKFFPWLYRFEKKKAEKYGMKVIPVTINASPIAPSETHVRQILCLLADKRLRPIYFHCDVGRDRTTLIATLYEIYFRGMAAEDAWREMKHFGFKDDWTLHGLKSYVHKHASSGFNAAECDLDSTSRR